MLLNPSTNTVRNVSGVQFRSAIPGSPARVVAQLVGPEDPQLAAGTTFQGTLNAAGAVGASVGIYDKSFTTVSIAGTAAETILYQLSIPAVDNAAGSFFRTVLLGNYLHNNVAADSIRIRVYGGVAGTTLLLDTNADSLGGVASPLAEPWDLELYLPFGGIARPYARLSTLPAGTVGGPGSEGSWSAAGREALMSAGSSIAIGSDMILRVTGQWSAAAATNVWEVFEAFTEKF